LTLLVGRQEGHPACKKWWGAGVVICLERGADLHMAQLMALPLTVSCFSKIQIGFTALVPADQGSPGQRAVKRVCVCVCARVRACEKTCNMLQEWLSVQPAAVDVIPSNEIEAEIVHQDNTYGLYFCFELISAL